MKRKNLRKKKGTTESPANGVAEDRVAGGCTPVEPSTEATECGSPETPEPADPMVNDAEQQETLAGFSSLISPDNGESPMQIQAHSRATLGTGLQAALDAGHVGLREALKLTHEQLNSVGVPHVLIGGVAVGVHGFPHYTDDLDFLVQEDKAFVVGPLLTFRAGVPIRSGKIQIDYLVPEGPEVVQRKGRECLKKAAENPSEIIVVPTDLLTYLKLYAGRAKDIAAVVELLKAGTDANQIQTFLNEAGNPDVLARFDRCLKMASEEE